MRNCCSKKVPGGTGILPVVRTGWKPVPPKAAGTEARPTDFFMNPATPPD
jgi:hypothetical protein